MAYRGLETLKCRLLAPLANLAAQKAVIIQCTGDDDKDNYKDKDKDKDKTRTGTKTNQ